MGTSFTCSKLHPEALGSMAVLVAGDVIAGKSTIEIPQDLLSKAGLADAAERREVRP